LFNVIIVTYSFDARRFKRLETIGYYIIVLLFPIMMSLTLALVKATFIRLQF